MNNNIMLKLLLIAFFGVTFATHLICQNPNDEMTMSTKKKKYDLNKKASKLPKNQTQSTDLSIYRIIDSKPKLNRVAYFPNWEKYVKEHLKYPQLAHDYSIEGTVQAALEIDSLGTPSSVQIMQSLGFGCDEAVMNLLSNMPNWSPKVKNGKSMSQKVILNIRFILAD
jgi:TonB family protein